MEKAILLNSGGKDSLATAKLMREQYELHSLFISAGSLSDSRAMRSSKMIADAYCASHYAIKIPGAWSTPSPQVTWPIIPHQLVTYHGIAAMYGESQHQARVIISGRKSNATREGFEGRLQEVFADSTISAWPITVLAPLMTLPSEEFAALVENDPVYPYTVGCVYDPPCGVCAKCVGREVLA